MIFSSMVHVFHGMFFQKNGEDPFFGGFIQSFYYWMFRLFVRLFVGSRGVPRGDKDKEVLPPPKKNMSILKKAWIFVKWEIHLI